jgi:hypothetical protein
MKVYKRVVQAKAERALQDYADVVGTPVKVGDLVRMVDAAGRPSGTSRRGIVLVANTDYLNIGVDYAKVLGIGWVACVFLEVLNEGR